jgi:hypothetical protein
MMAHLGNRRVVFFVVSKQCRLKAVPLSVGEGKRKVCRRKRVFCRNVGNMSLMTSLRLVDDLVISRFRDTLSKKGRQWSKTGLPL